MAHLRHLELCYSKYWSLQDAFWVQSKFLFDFNAALSQIEFSPPNLNHFSLIFFFKCRNGDLTACRLYGLFVCVLFVLQKSSWMQEKNKTISKPFLHFNLIDLFHYILDETFNFLFKVLNHFNISSFIWKKDVWKSSDSKETGLNDVFFQKSQNLILTGLPNLDSQYSTYYCLELPAKQKGRQRFCPVFSQATRKWSAHV